MTEIYILQILMITLGMVVVNNASNFNLEILVLLLTTFEKEDF